MRWWLSRWLVRWPAHTAGPLDDLGPATVYPDRLGAYAPGYRPGRLPRSGQERRDG
jgi:hypothetical protein